ncbi:SH3 domain-containing protein [uncultured Sphingomonas sp.]|uniref:SH3 domain-containing protein n=1 Tax=uncultured Sphingomonas sp. TaxID=158754 RepID=UPI00260EB02B|nr:SH3 domain-containing protein [uncultured Sphingomonas sp.]
MRRVPVLMAMAAAGALIAGDAMVGGLTVHSAIAADQPKKAPYFASIAPSRARMRSGPGRSYPATWLYVRADLPVRVVDAFKDWRKVEDPAGVQGWMQGKMVSQRRTALVLGEIVELREKPSAGGKVTWRAEPGVVGRVSQCGGGWCRFDVNGRAGFVETDHLWGVAPEETLP